MHPPVEASHDEQLSLKVSFTNTDDSLHFKFALFIYLINKRFASIPGASRWRHRENCFWILGKNIQPAIRSINFNFPFAVPHEGKNFSRASSAFEKCWCLCRISESESFPFVVNIMGLRLCESDPMIREHQLRNVVECISLDDPGLRGSYSRILRNARNVECFGETIISD